MYVWINVTYTHAHLVLAMNQISFLMLVGWLSDQYIESNMGFTMDSLLKLNTSKAFDKKTSVLQYVITLLFRNDLDALLLTEDLKSVVEVNTHTYIHT